MVDDALLLTRRPGAVGREGVDRLREHGFDDPRELFERRRAERGRPDPG